MLAGFYAAGVYSGQTAADIKMNKRQMMALEEKNNRQMMALEEKIKATEEKIKRAKEEAKNEALEHLFKVINQSKYESSKKAIQESPIQKNLIEFAENSKRNR